ncbi:MAG: hypothetical protein HUU20_10135 [Pirellulales bacterium]|nr:hypothetical protein [Pirellulales bacterium]
MRITRSIVHGRVKELEERYAQPLPDLEREVEDFAEKVGPHLETTGLVLA